MKKSTRHENKVLKIVKMLKIVFRQGFISNRRIRSMFDDAMLCYAG